MKLLRRLRARLRYRHFERDLAEELEFHQAMKEGELASGGVPADEARWRAAREMGNATLMREDARAVWLAPWLESTSQDARYAARSFRRNPGFAATATLVLMLGIGLNSRLFTVLNAVSLRPWPVRDPESVVYVQARPEASREGPCWPCRSRSAWCSSCRPRSRHAAWRAQYAATSGSR